MLILMGLAPSGFALDGSAPAGTFQTTVAAVSSLQDTLRNHTDRASLSEADEALAQLDAVRAHLKGRAGVTDIPKAERFQVRQAMLLADTTLTHLKEGGGFGLTPAEEKKLAADRKTMLALTEYAPRWVLVAIALSLGVGTMVGWKRIVITVGEKIGKTHLTYAQGASAEFVAASTILLATRFGLPVSTTHVLSSGIAGTMVAHKAGLQASTVRNIALAWVLTLPVSMCLSAVLFLVFRALLA
jgi:PiT family inorganic phosphate transporter